MTRTSPAERSVAAAERALEPGHRHYARVQDDGSILVKSDSRPGKSWRVTFGALRVGEPIVFTCRPEGNTAYADDHRDLTGKAGYVACRHAALAARRLEREGLAYVAFGSGAFVLSQKAADLTERHLPEQPADPFAGLPK